MAFLNYQLTIKRLGASRMLSSLQSKNYRLYFLGQGISLIGSWMQSIAMSWLVYRLTGSVFLLGVVGFCSQIPSFFLSPFAGVLTDRFNRHRIMITTQVFFMIQAFVLAALVLFNVIAVWHIIALSLFFGLITAFDAPARQSLVIDLIDNPEHLPNAIALNSAIFNGARLFGPAVAGLLIAVIGEGGCFLINSLSYIAVISALLKIQINPKIKNIKPGLLRQEFKEGFSYTFGFPPIRTLIILLSIISLAGMSYGTIMPAYAAGLLKGGSNTLGFLMAAAGAGAFTGALMLASRKTVVGLGKVIAINSIVFGASLAIASFPFNLWYALLVMYFVGFSMIASVASINSLIQTLAEEEKRGRVMSFYAMALMGINPIGNLLLGTLASGIGLSYALLITGSVTAAAGIWFATVRPSLRQYTTPIYIRKGLLHEE